MSLLKPFGKLPSLNEANILLVENDEQFQQHLADSIVQADINVTVNVRLAKTLPLPVNNEDSRPRIDLVVFIINLTSELSLQSAHASLKHLDPGYFLGKVCFMVTNARHAAVPAGRLDTVRRLAASLHCPLLCAEHETAAGVSGAAERLLTVLSVAAGLVPMTTALYLSSVTRCTAPLDAERRQSFD